MEQTARRVIETSERPQSIRNAFVGPRPYPVDRQLYGRDRELIALSNRLLSERLVLLYSPSGAGKTSLILAQGGLKDRMTSEGLLVLPVIRVDHCAEASLRVGVNRYLVSTLDALEQVRAEDVRRKPEELAQLIKGSAEQAIPAADFFCRYLDSLLRELSPIPVQPLLIFDQFEELLTHDPTDRPVKEQFLEQIGNALQDRDRWALFAMREDHVAALDPYLPLMPTRLSATFRLNFLSKSAAEEAIERPPAEDEFGVVIQPDAVNELTDQLALINVQNPLTGKSESKDGEYVEPLQLQVVCQRLWEQRKPKSGDRISKGDLELLRDKETKDLHGVDAALAGYYSDCLRTVVKEFSSKGPSERDLRRWFSRALISDSGFRIPVLLGAESAFHLTPQVLRSLEDKYLIRNEQRHGAIYYELAHDRLVNPIRESNAAYRRALPRFQQAAETWDDCGRRRELIVGGVVINEGRRLAREGAPLSTVDRQFLKECNRASVIRFSIAGIVLATFVLSGLFWWSSARRQKSELAIDEARVTVDAARKLLTDSPKESARKIIEGMHGYLDNNALQKAPDGIMSETLPFALANRGMSTLGRAIDRHGGPVVEILHDENHSEWLFSRGLDGSARCWKNPTSETPEMTCRILGVTSFAATPDGKNLVVGHVNGQICRWHNFDRTAADPYDVLRPASSGNTPVTCLSVTTRENVPARLAAGYADGGVILFDWKATKQLATWNPSKRAIVNAVLTPNPIRVLVNAQDGFVTSWNIEGLDTNSKVLDESSRAQEIPIDKTITQIAISKIADVFAVGTSSGEVFFYEMRSWGDKKIRTEYVRSEGGQLNGPITILTFSSRSAVPKATTKSESAVKFRAFAATSQQSSVVYEFTESEGDDDSFGRPPAPTARTLSFRNDDTDQPEDKIYVTAAAFSDDSKWIVAGTSSGMTYVWATDDLSNPKAQLQTSASPISSVTLAVAGDNQSNKHTSLWVFTGAMDGNIRRWKVNTETWKDSKQIRDAIGINESMNRTQASHVLEQAEHLLNQE